MPNSDGDRRSTDRAVPGSATETAAHTIAFATDCAPTGYTEGKLAFRSPVLLGRSLLGLTTRAKRDYADGVAQLDRVVRVPAVGGHDPDQSSLILVSLKKDTRTVPLARTRAPRASE